MTTGAIGDKYVCSMCHKFANPRFEPVLRHISSVHSWEPNLHLTCGIDGCPRTYSSYQCLRKHLQKQHSEFVHQENPFSSSALEDSEPFDCTQSPEPDHGDQVILKHAGALFLLKAKEQYKITQIALDGLVCDISDMLQTTVTQLGDAVKECLTNANCDPKVVSQINAVFDEYKDPFDGLQTAYLQKKFYSNHFNLIVSCNCNNDFLFTFLTFS